MCDGDNLRQNSEKLLNDYKMVPIFVQLAYYGIRAVPNILSVFYSIRIVGQIVYSYLTE